MIFVGLFFVKFRIWLMKRIVLLYVLVVMLRYLIFVGVNWFFKKWLWFIKCFVIGKLGRVWCVLKIGWSG